MKDSLIVFIFGGFILLFCGGLVADLSTSKPQGRFCNVINKYYVPPRDETVWETDDDGWTTSHVVHHPEQWNVNLVYAGDKITIDTSPDKWNSVQPNTQVPVTVRIGGFTGLRYFYTITEVEH